jgi:hypothetical protein
MLPWRFQSDWVSSFFKKLLSFQEGKNRRSQNFNRFIYAQTERFFFGNSARASINPPLPDGLRRPRKDGVYPRPRTLRHPSAYCRTIAQVRITNNELLRRKQRSIKNPISFYIAASGGEFNPKGIKIFGLDRQYHEKGFRGLKQQPGSRAAARIIWRRVAWMQIVWTAKSSAMQQEIQIKPWTTAQKTPLLQNDPTLAERQSPMTAGSKKHSGAAFATDRGLCFTFHQPRGNRKTSTRSGMTSSTARKP